MLRSLLCLLAPGEKSAEPPRRLSSGGIGTCDAEVLPPPTLTSEGRTTVLRRIRWLLLLPAGCASAAPPSLEIREEGPAEAAVGEERAGVSPKEDVPATPREVKGVTRGGRLRSLLPLPWLLRGAGRVATTLEAKMPDNEKCCSRVTGVKQE